MHTCQQDVEPVSKLRTIEDPPGADGHLFSHLAVNTNCLEVPSQRARSSPLPPLKMGLDLEADDVAHVLRGYEKVCHSRHEAFWGE